MKKASDLAINEQQIIVNEQRSQVNLRIDNLSTMISVSDHAIRMDSSILLSLAGLLISILVYNLVERQFLKLKKETEVLSSPLNNCWLLRLRSKVM